MKYELSTNANTNKPFGVVWIGSHAACLSQVYHMVGTASSSIDHDDEMLRQQGLQ